MPNSSLHQLHLRPDTVARNGIQADGRFVEDQQRRPVHQRLRQLEPADHAAGVRAGQPRRRRRAAASRPALRRPDRTRSRRGHVVEPGEQLDVLPACQRGFDRKLLRHIADVVPDVHGVPTRVEAEDVHLAALHRRQGGQHAHHGGLARSVRAEQADASRRSRTCRREVVDRGEVAVAVGQVPTVDRKRRHGCLSCSMRVISASTSNPRSRLSSWLGSSSSSTADSAARRAARDSSAMRCAGSVSRSRPTRRSSASTVRMQQAVGRELGHQGRRGVGNQPQLGGRLADGDVRLAADQAQQFGLRLRSARRRRIRGRSTGAVDGGTGRRR